MNSSHLSVPTMPTRPEHSLNNPTTSPVCQMGCIMKARYTLMFKTSAGQVHNDLPLQASIDPFSPTVIPPKLLAGAPQSPQWPRGRRWPSLMYNRFAGSLSQKLPPLLSIAEFIITSASELVDPDEVDLLFIWRGRRCCQTEMSPTTT
jgi:hypothetical protein